MATGGAGTGGSGGVLGSGGNSVGGGAAAGGSGGSAGSPAGTGGATASGGAGTGGVVATGGTATGGSASGGMSSGGSGTGGAAGGAGGATAVDTARYNFESSVQSWGVAPNTPAFASISTSTAQQAAGQSSLAGAIAASAAATYQLSVQPTTAVAAGSTVTFHVFYPAGAPIAWVQPYGLEGDPNYKWYGTARTISAGTWNTLTVAIPSTANPVLFLGVQFKLTGAWTGTVYVDAVTW